MPVRSICLSHMGKLSPSEKPTCLWCNPSIGLQSGCCGGHSSFFINFRFGLLQMGLGNPTCVKLAETHKEVF